MNKNKIIKERDLIISQIRKYAPLFAPFLELEETLEEYSNRMYDFEVLDVHKKRQQIIKKAITKKLQKLFGDDWQKKLHVNLDTKLAFNIVDHHQILNHALLIGSNIISSYNKFFKDTKQDAIIVISSGDVPPNNYFSKMGFQFHDKKVPLFIDSEKRYSTYYMPNREFKFIEKLKTMNRWSEFSKDEQQYLIELQEIFQNIDYSKCEGYKDQVTLLLKKTWPLLFEESIRETAPELIYITTEETVTQALIELLKNDEDNFITACLLDKQFQEKVLNQFRGIVVCWNEKEDKGTHFLWRKHPTEPKSLRMWIDGDKLIPADERFKDLTVDLNKETLIELLEKREIYPSLFLAYSVLHFYSGIKPLAGYGSVMYLQFFREGWKKVFKDTRFEDEIKLIDNVQINQFVGGVPLFFEKNGEDVKTLYATDIFFKGGISKDYLQKVFKMKFNEFVSVAAADLYDYFSQKYIPESEKINPTINFDDLAKVTFTWL